MDGKRFLEAKSEERAEDEGEGVDGANGGYKMNIWGERSDETVGEGRGIAKEASEGTKEDEHEERRAETIERGENGI